jgi:hypothetical protein
MTNILATLIVAIVTNYSTQLETIGSRPIPCPDYKGGAFMCAVYHCEPIFSPTDYTETMVVSSNTYSVLRYKDVEKKELLESVELERKTRRVFERVTIAKMTSDWQVVSNTWITAATNCTINFTNMTYIIATTNGIMLSDTWKDK